MISSLVCRLSTILPTRLTGLRLFRTPPRADLLPGYFDRRGFAPPRALAWVFFRLGFF